MSLKKKTKLPYEKTAEAWREYTRTFKATIHLAMNLQDRELWSKSPELADLKVFSSGCYTQAKGHYWKRKGLDEGVYIYCTAGKGQYTQGSKTWTIKPGDLLYCRPMTRHEYKADDENPWTIYWMHVSGPRIKMFEKHLGFASGNPIINIGLNPEIVDQFKRMFTFFQTVNNDTNKLAIQSVAADILGTMAVVAHSDKIALHYSQKISSVLEFMKDSISQKYSVSVFARQAGISPFHFSRLFKKTTGLAPVHYFNRLKIQQACTLLAGSRMKIKEVAYFLGFDDQYYFSRCFKNIMGFPPEKCRQSDYKP